MGGKWLVRIDDLDPLRCKPAYSDQILKTLELYELTWDEDIFYQSNRTEAYKSALKQLDQQHLLYPCSCSRKDLLSRHCLAGKYDLYCLAHPPTSTQTVAFRIKLPTNNVSFNDLVQGNIQQSLQSDVGDFIVFRKGATSSYHLAVVVDDNEQNITEVVRGHDLLSSTPRQIMLQQLLNLNTPSYAHIPVISHTDGSKLSKQTFADDVSAAPVKTTLIDVLSHLNLNPPKDLLSCTVSDILNWGIENWSLKKIKQQDSILFRSH